MQTRNPTDHAEVLLKETSLPSHEIAKMTGLDVYEVFGIKLKNRSYKFRRPHRRGLRHKVKKQVI